MLNQPEKPKKVAGPDALTTPAPAQIKNGSENPRTKVVERDMATRNVTLPSPMGDASRVKPEQSELFANYREFRGPNSKLDANYREFGKEGFGQGQNSKIFGEDILRQDPNFKNFGEGIFRQNGNSKNFREDILRQGPNSKNFRENILGQDTNSKKNFRKDILGQDTNSKNFEEPRFNQVPNSKNNKEPHSKKEEIESTEMTHPEKWGVFAEENKDVSSSDFVWLPSPPSDHSALLAPSQGVIADQKLKEINKMINHANKSVAAQTKNDDIFNR